MKAKFTITKHDSLQLLIERASRGDFYAMLFSKVAERLEIQNILERPAEYYAQEPDISVVINPEVLGVTFQLTAISRDGRSTNALRWTYDDICVLVTEFVRGNMATSGPKVQVTVSIALDGQVEYETGRYSPLIDTYAVILDPPQPKPALAMA